MPGCLASGSWNLVGDQPVPTAAHVVTLAWGALRAKVETTGTRPTEPACSTRVEPIGMERGGRRLRKSVTSPAVTKPFSPETEQVGMPAANEIVEIWAIYAALRAPLTEQESIPAKRHAVEVVEAVLGGFKRMNVGSPKRGSCSTT
jgi:hypothetical protein